MLMQMSLFCSFYYWVIFYCMYHIFFFFSTSSPAFFVYRVFDGGHFILCEVIPYWSFDLHFFNNEWCWASFHVLFSNLHAFFGEMSLYILRPFFDCFFFFPMLRCISCLYILEINPLSVVLFTKTKSRTTIWCKNSIPGISMEEIINVKDTCTTMFTAALFIIAKTWKQS